MGKNRRKITILIASSVFLFLSFLSVLFAVLQNKHLYQERFNPKAFQKKYSESQWVVPQSKKPVSDEELYAYSGYRYINGENPILINSEVPPLGKYLIGLSIVLFENQRIVSLALAVLSLLLIFFLIYIVSRSFVQSSLGVFLTSINSLFVDQFVFAPQLDIFQLFFLLIFVICLIMHNKTDHTKYLIGTGIALGAFSSIKFFLIYYGVINATLLIFYFLKKERVNKILFNFTIINLFALAVYILTYFQYFVLGGTLRSFLGVQKWIALFYLDSTIPISKLLGNYLSLIFFNRWRFWTEGLPIIHYQYWSILWPIIFLLGIISLYRLLKDRTMKKNSLTLFLVGFFLIYNIFLFSTPVFPRYLLLLFIPLNIFVAMYYGTIIENRLK